MIAHVVPLLRLPRRFRHFDYASTTPVAVGDVVLVPFKGRDVRGVVVDVATSSDEPGLKAITSIEERGAITKGDVKRIMHLAERTAQSAAAYFALALPEPKNGSITFVAPTTKVTTDPKRIASVQQLLATLRDAHSGAVQATVDEAVLFTLALRKTTKQQLLVLVPLERDAELIASTVPLGDGAAVLHGKSSPLERSSVAKGWRSGTVRTLIGTRQATLLAANRLDAVLVFASGNDEHKSSRRNPRFDARDAALLLARQHGARIIAVDTLPRPEDVQAADQTVWSDWPAARMIDVGKPQEKSEVSLVSASLIEEIKSALQSQKSVLLLFNRKGVAKRLQCKDCGHIPLCGTCTNMPTVRVDDLVCERCGAEMWIPKVCPACSSPKLRLRGIGGAKLEADLKEAFPAARVTRAEKGSADASGDIVLATEFYFSSVAKPFGRRFGLVADIMADVGLIGNDFRSTERVARRIARLRSLAEESNGTCIVQTFTRDALEPLLDGKHFVASELTTRETYRLPPYASIVDVTEGEKTTHTRADAESFMSTLTQLDHLPDTTTIMVDHPSL